MRSLMSVLAAALVATPSAGQEVVRVSGNDVAVFDLAGRVEVIRGSGPDVVVHVARGGEDAAELRVETGEIDGRSTLRVVFPDDEIVYPEMGRGSSTSLRVRDDGTFGDGFGLAADRVTIRGTGSGLEAWADLVIEVPPGRTFSAYLGAGRMEASGVDGEVRLDTGSGRVRVSDMSGSLRIDTGSGGVDVQGMSGRLSIDTGSGGVDVAGVVGDVVEIDTGSGSVDGRGIETLELSVDTGSGSVELSDVLSRDIEVDTGSGSIELDLATDVDRLVLDTGSGSVTVRAPDDLGGEVEIDTGSGGIELGFPVEMVGRLQRDRIRGRLGDGEGTIRIDTGSGSVRVLRGG